jgi:hypothetical protein
MRARGLHAGVADQAQITTPRQVDDQLLDEGSGHAHGAREAFDGGDSIVGGDEFEESLQHR